MLQKETSQAESIEVNTEHTREEPIVPSLKEAATIELLKSELRTLIGAIEQNQFFADNGTEFERKAASRYAIDKALKAQAFLRKITDLENSKDSTG